MQKQDLAVFVGAIIIVLVLAFVVKPIMDGESLLPEQEPENNALPSKIPVPEGSSVSPYTPSTVMEATPAPTPWWNGTAYNVQFVDPSTYNIQWESQMKDFGYSIPAYTEPESNEMILYATINGQWDATTQIVNIPYPIWIMETIIEPIGDVGIVDRGSRESNESVEGLFASEGESLGAEPGKMHYITPSINVQVINADNPDGETYILNSLTEGPLPLETDTSGRTSEAFFSIPDEDTETSEDEDEDSIENVPSRDTFDEYKWVHRFFDEAGNYYFIINPNMLKSYTIDIYVPKKYIES